MLNRTHLEHSLFAVALQFALSPLVGLGAAGVAALLFLCGREYAQAEYKARESTGRSLTDMMPWHLLKLRYWSLDALLDVLIPAIFCASIAACLQ